MIQRDFIWQDSVRVYREASPFVVLGPILVLFGVDPVVDFGKATLGAPT